MNRKLLNSCGNVDNNVENPVVIKKKGRFFTKISMAVLAGFMFCLPIFAGCAPAEILPQNPSPGQNFNLGLDPKNDPIVYTTESGLEIKMSNANKFAGAVTTTTNTGYTYTQDLSSFYYFTMGTFSGTIYTAKTQTDTYKVTNEPVNWIILGVGSHSNAFIDSVSNYLFSTIKNNDYLFSNGEYYFDNQHETYSPAGQLIDSTVSTKTYIMGKVKDSIKVHTEIPKGCMLVLSEKLLGQMYFNSTGNINETFFPNDTANGNIISVGSKNFFGNRYRYKGDISAYQEQQTWNNKTDGNLYTYINNLFSRNTSGTILQNGLGLTQAQADLIVPQQLYTYYYDGRSNLQETPSTDGGTYYTMFPLARRTVHTSTYQNFCIEDYLTTNAQMIASLIGSNQSYCWYFRSGSRFYEEIACYADGVNVTGIYINTATVSHSFGVRPAMVMKLA